MKRFEIIAALRKVVGYDLGHIQFLLESYRDMDSDAAFDEAREIVDFVKSFKAKVEVFRVVYVKKKSDIVLEKLGNHWTHSKEKAKEFAINNLSKPWYLISGTIDKKFINWEQTVDQMIRIPWEEELYIDNYNLKNLKDLKITPLK